MTARLPETTPGRGRESAARLGSGPVRPPASDAEDLPERPVDAAVQLLSALLANGPVPCKEVGRRADAAGLARPAQAHARRRLGVEVVRESGEPMYRLPAE